MLLRTNQVNLCFIRQDLTPQVLTFRHAIELRDDLLPGESALKIVNSPIAFPASTVLIFGNGQTVTTSTPTLLGAATVGIPTHTGLKIPVTEAAPAQPIDLTGRTYTAKVKALKTSTTNLFTLSCIVNNALGTVSLALPSGVTTPSNAVTRQFQTDRLGKPDPNTSPLFSSTNNHPLINTAYYWELSYVQASVTTIALNGYFWLIKEVV